MAQMRKKRKNTNEKGCSSIESSQKKELISSSSSWSSLPNDVLVNIFNRLVDDRTYLFWVISSVCRSWQLACWDILFWKENQDYEQLNLGGLASFCQDNYDQLDIALPRVITSVFDRNGDVLKDIPHWRSLAFDMRLPLAHNSDKYLVFVAERTPKLQRVSIDMHGITGKGFSRSIRNWRQLEEIFMLSLGDCHSTHFIQEIGINCRQLKILSMLSISDCYRSRFCLDEYNSQLIADNLRSLTKSGISGCYINKFGLMTLMSKCKQIERVCLDNCIRTLEDVKLTRGRGALDARPFKVIPEPLSAVLQKCEGSHSEWLIHKVAGKHNVRSVVNYLWTEVGDASTSD